MQTKLSIHGRKKLGEAKRTLDLSSKSKKEGK